MPPNYESEDDVESSEEESVEEEVAVSKKRRTKAWKVRILLSCGSLMVDC